MNVTDEVCRAHCDAARCAGEVKGRADERAAVVAWLRERGYVAAAETARQIERGEHERLKPTHANRCPHCKRYFTTPQGLGQHFRHARRNKKLCEAKP